MSPFWAVPILALAFTILRAAPCLACSCDLDTPADRVRAASVIFVGTVTSIDETDSIFTTVDGGKEQRIRFSVERVLKGETTATTAVRAYADSGFCGYRFTLGARYTVFTGGTTTSLCAGTTDGAVDPQRYGLAGRPPLPDPPFASTPAVPILVPIVAAALALGGAVWLGLRRRRTLTLSAVADGLGLSRRDLVASAVVGTGIVLAAHVLAGQSGDRAISSLRGSPAAT